MSGLFWLVSVGTFAASQLLLLFAGAVVCARTPAGRGTV